MNGIFGRDGHMHFGQPESTIKFQKVFTIKYEIIFVNAKSYRLYHLTQFNLTDFTSLEFPPIMI